MLGIRRRTLIKIGLPVLVLVLVLIFAPPMLKSAADTLDIGNANSGPGPDHWFGTDQLGRDVLARTLVATRISILLAVAATAISVSVGAFIGIGLSLAPKAVRNVGLRIIDALMSFPAILLGIILAAILGPGSFTAVIAIAVAGAPSTARLTNNIAAGQLRMDYVQNARVIGLGTPRLIRRYLMPPILRSLGITVTYDIGLNLVALASLSFLGIGVQVPQYDWGQLLASGITQLNLNVWAAVVPTVAITVVGAACAILGESLSQWGSRSTSRGSRSQSSAMPPVSHDSGSAQGSDSVVRAEGLTIEYPDAQTGERTTVVDEVSLTVGLGEIVGIIGESGSGKSTVANALTDLLPATAAWKADTLQVTGVDLCRRDRARIDRTFRSSVAMVFQESMSSLNPGISIGRQLREVYPGGRKTGEARAVEVLDDVRVTQPHLRLLQRAFELSGGMCQRVMIGIGLMVHPQLLVADEPTTALDVTVQKQILAILARIRDEHGTSVLFISHDIAVVASICDRIYVMRDGRIVEQGAAEEIVNSPQHPYTRELLRSVVTLETPRGGRSSAPERGMV